MIEFAWPFMFILIPLPWILKFILPRGSSSKQAALNAADPIDFTPFEIATKFKTGSIRNPLILIATLAWICLIGAAARPQVAGVPIQIPQTGRDLMLAIDLSGSMTTQDFEFNGKTLDRLSALKLIVGDFIDRREGDRLGLILFGSNAYLQTPLTHDRATVKQLLMESAVGLAGNETAIGDAIGLAVKHLKSTSKQSRVLILLTDGNNNTGEMTPLKAAELAANRDLKVHTVAIGSNEAMIRTVFGTRKIHPSADIDEKTLQAVAEKTGGKYFRAYDTKELASIYKELDIIEPIEKENKYYRPVDEIYYIPLLISLILFAGLSTFKVFK